MSGQTTELQELVLLESPCQFQVVEVVKAVNRVSQGLVVLLLDQEVVVGIIDSFNVTLLDSDQIGLDERNVVIVLSREHLHNPSVIDTQSQYSEQVGDERRLLLQIEAESLWFCVMLA